MTSPSNLPSRDFTIRELDAGAGVDVLGDGFCSAGLLACLVAQAANKSVVAIVTEVRTVFMVIVVVPWLVEVRLVLAQSSEKIGSWDALNDKEAHQSDRRASEYLGAPAVLKVAHLI